MIPQYARYGKEQERTRKKLMRVLALVAVIYALIVFATINYVFGQTLVGAKFNMDAEVMDNKTVNPACQWDIDGTSINGELSGPYLITDFDTAGLVEDQVYTLTCTCSDEAGNVGSDSLQFTVDRTGPNVQIRIFKTPPGQQE